MEAKCHAAAAALGLAGNPSYKALVASLHDEQLQQLEAILLAAKSVPVSGSANLNADANPHAALPAQAFALIPNVACLEPRGRWDILFSETEIMFRNKKGVVQKVTREQVSTCVHVQVKAISGKTEHLFLVACSAPVQLVGMKKQPTVLGWKFPSTPSAADTPALQCKPDSSKLRNVSTSSIISAAGAKDLNLESMLSSPERFSAWLCEACLAPLDTPAQAAFASSTGATHVQATHVVDTGCLHPLRSGLAFTSKPLLWLPFAGMESMECDQRGFGGQARYWDLRVQMKGAAAAVEFKNISAGEKDLVQGFLATRMEEVGEEGGTGGDSASGAATTHRAEDASGPAVPAVDSEEEDSDFSEGGGSDSEGGGSDNDSSGSNESDSDDGSEATFPDADDDNSVEFVEEDAGQLSGAEEAAAAVAAEKEGGRKRSRRGGAAALVVTAVSSDDSDESDATQEEVAPKQARRLDGGDLDAGASLGAFVG